MERIYLAFLIQGLKTCGPQIRLFPLLHIDINNFRFRQRLLASGCRRNTHHLTLSPCPSGRSYSWLPFEDWKEGLAESRLVTVIISEICNDFCEKGDNIKQLSKDISLWITGIDEGIMGESTEYELTSWRTHHTTSPKGSLTYYDWDYLHRLPQNKWNPPDFRDTAYAHIDNSSFTHTRRSTAKFHVLVRGWYPTICSSIRLLPIDWTSVYIPCIANIMCEKLTVESTEIFLEMDPGVMEYICLLFRWRYCSTIHEQWFLCFPLMLCVFAFCSNEQSPKGLDSLIWSGIRTLQKCLRGCCVYSNITQ